MTLGRIFVTVLAIVCLVSASSLATQKVEHSRRRVLIGKAPSTIQWDTQNIPFLFWSDGYGVQLKGTLKDGEYSHEERHPLSWDVVNLHSMVRLDGSRRIVVLGWTTGGVSSINTVVVQLVEERNGQLFLLEQLEGRAEAEAAGATYDSGRKTLTLHTTADYSAGECCPRLLETTIYKVSPSGFRRVSHDSKPLAVPH